MRKRVFAHKLRYLAWNCLRVRLVEYLYGYVTGCRQNIRLAIFRVMR